MMRSKVTGAQRWVVKIGSALLTADGKGLDRAAMSVWVEQMVALHEAGVELVLVSSGAVAAGMSRLGWTARPSAMHELQAAAAIGQMGLVQAWESSFAEHGRHTAQVLLTHDDLSDRKRYLNARSTLRALVELKVIPVINENDTVVTDEIRFGDNDTLAALVANLVEADLLVILTDRDGMFDADPRNNPDAQLIYEARADDPALDAYLASSAVENASLIPAESEPGIEGVALEKLLLSYASAQETIARNSHRYDRQVLEALIDFTPMDLEHLRKAGADEGLAALATRLNQGSLGSPRYTLELQEPTDERPAAVLVTRRHMGEQLIQVLPLAAFETGELRALHQSSLLLHGLVRAGAKISRGAKSAEVGSFAEARNWLLDEAKKGRQIQRFKGLGEMNPEQLWDTTVNPDTRRLLQVRIEDAVAADQIFSTLMGDVVEPRRDFIEDNALKVANLDI